MEKALVNHAPKHKEFVLLKTGLYLLTLALCICAHVFLSDVPALSTPFPRYFIFALPVLLVLVLDTLPSLISRRRLVRLKDLGREGQIMPSGYFRLTPYGNTREDREKYNRSDREHEKVFEWLVNGEERISYLSGRSGTGKSSLLNAHVLPNLGGPPHFWKVLTLSTGSDPLASLTQALLEPGLVWPEPPTQIKDLKLLLARACGQARFPLLIVWDQFEEFLIHNDEDNPKLSAFTSFVHRMIEEGPGNLKLLLVFRTDYLHPMLELELPALNAHQNWQEISPFLPAEARAFLRSSDLEISHRLLEHLLHEIYEIEETKGLVRPITLNMIGRVLSSSGKSDRAHLSYEHGMTALMADDLRLCLQRPVIRRYAADLLKPMLTEDGTKQARSVAELAWESGIDPDIIRGTLVYLGNHGLVRRLDAVNERWVLAHDFVAKQLDLILRKWRPHLFRRWRVRLIFMGLVVWTTVLFGLFPAFQAAMHDRTLAAIVRTGGEVSEDEDGLSVRFRSHPRLDHTTGFLERLPNLYKLDLSKTSVTDLTALARLENLRVLLLNGAVHADLKTLNGLAQLEELQLVDMPLTEIASLQRMTNLRVIDLSGSKVEHLTAVAGFPHLRVLAMRNTGVRTIKIEKRDINFAELSLLELMRVEVTPDNVPYLTELVGAPQLTWLDLKGTFVSGLEPLQALPNLTGLELAETRVSDLNALTVLRNLTYLDLHGTDISDLQALSALKGLTYLDVSKTTVRNLEPITALKNLEHLDLGRTDVADLAPLKNLKALRRLDLSFTLVADISILIELNRLTELDLSGSSVKALISLEGLSQLQELDLAETEVRDLSPLKSNVELTHLDLSRTPVEDLYPIYNLRRLRTLVLSDGAVDLEELKALRRALPRVKLVFTNGE